MIKIIQSKERHHRDRYHDIGTNDFLTGLMEKHEKMAWMLRAYVEGKSV